MLKIIVECDTPDELAAILDLYQRERDDLRDRIATLESQPLRYSLPNLAREVLGDFKGLTPDQSRSLKDKIENCFL